MSRREEQLFTLLKVSIYIQNMNKKSEKELGLSLVQWALLRHLIDMPATSAFALAKAVGVHPSTLTQTLKRLEKKSFIFVAEDPKDSRKKVISITRQGMEILHSAKDQIENWSKDLSTLTQYWPSPISFNPPYSTEVPLRVHHSST